MKQTRKAQKQRQTHTHTHIYMCIYIYIYIHTYMYVETVWEHDIIHSVRKGCPIPGVGKLFVLRARQ